MKPHVKRPLMKMCLQDWAALVVSISWMLRKWRNLFSFLERIGVGTKLKIAFLMDKRLYHRTRLRGHVCRRSLSGAKPLFFLDYIATGHVKAEKIADIVKDITDGALKLVVPW